jgi:hypothetical protein
VVHSGPQTEIELKLSIEGGRTVAVGSASFFAYSVLSGVLAGIEAGKFDRSRMKLVARLLLLLFDALATAPSVPARAALSAALAARNAAIEGDAEAVDAFSRTWLGLSRPEAWREAVEMALLGDWVQELGHGRATDDYINDLLHRHASSEHRALQPVWERRVRGKRTVLLGQPLGPDLTVEDLLAERRTPEDATLGEELADSRLLAVLRGLAADEAALARAWAADGESWAQATLDAELPAAYGERVRRKLKRLGARYAERAAAAAHSVVTT